MTRTAVATDIVNELFIGLDPGNMTGIAWIVMNDLGEGPPQFEQVPQRMAVQRLGQILTPFNGSTDSCVAIERFLITERTVRASRTRTPQHIGELENVCAQHSVPVDFQTASDAKNFATNKKLKRIGWYRPSMGHAMDAARHLLLLIARTRPHYFERLIG